MKARRQRDLALPAALAASAALFVSAGALLAPLAGVSSDEAIHADIAVRWLRPELFQTTSWLWLPWMSLPYMGTLKSLFLAPVFLLFGVGVGTLRAATLGFGVLGIAAFVCLVSELFGPAWAAAAGLWMALDPAWVLVCTFDSGPAALSVALKLAGLALLVRSAKEPPGRAAAFGAGLVFGLGVWDKAHFLWFLAALAVCAAAGRLSRARGLDRAAWVWLAVGLAIGAAPFLEFNLVHPLLTFLHPMHQGWSLSSHLAALPGWTSERFKTAAEALSGAYWAKFVSGAPLEGWERAYWIGPACQAGAAAWAAARLVRREGAGSLRGAGWWLLLGTATFAFACLAPLPVKAHHLYLLYPIPQLALIALLHRSFSRPPLTSRPFRFWGAALLGGQCAALAVSALALASTGGSPRFYRGLSDATRWIEDWHERHPGARMYGFAIENSVSVHSGGRLALLSGGPRGPFESPSASIVLLPQPAFGDSLREAQEAVSASRESGRELRLAAVFRYSDGREWLRAYEVPSSTAAASPKAPESAADRWVDLGVRRFAAGNAAAALRDFDAALSAAPRDPAILLSRGVVLQRLGRWSEAERSLDAAVRFAQADKGNHLRPFLPADALSSRASFWLARGVPVRAAADLREALRAASPDWPKVAQTRAQLGTLLDGN
jgi:tetratricopeptide (TPR) repeat protein